jgi:hypothetical protein
VAHRTLVSRGAVPPIRHRSSAHIRFCRLHECGAQEPLVSPSPFRRAGQLSMAAHDGRAHGETSRSNRGADGHTRLSAGCSNCQLGSTRSFRLQRVPWHCSSLVRSCDGAMPYGPEWRLPGLYPANYVYLISGKQRLRWSVIARNWSALRRRWSYTYRAAYPSRLPARAVISPLPSHFSDLKRWPWPRERG